MTTRTFASRPTSWAASAIRFGDGVNGMRLDNDATVTCDYQVGRGSAGNVGADALTGFDTVPLPNLRTIRNPFDVTNGRDPEPRHEIIRRVPQAYRQRQLRAVTLADYVKRAEELPAVSHAFARYAWTGSWRTVQVSIDPAGTTVLDEPTRREIAAHLDAVRLIGEDLEVRPARFVALDIVLKLCAHPDYWPDDLDIELQRSFSTGWTADGKPGLLQSRICGRSASRCTPARSSAARSACRAWSGCCRFRCGAGMPAPVPPPASSPSCPRICRKRRPTSSKCRPFEIMQVANNPDHLEQGRILFDIRGGRR